MATIHHDSGTGTTPTTPKEIADWLKDEMGEELSGEPLGDAIWYSPADEGEPGSVKFLIWNSVCVLSPAEFEELKRLLPATHWEEHVWDEEFPASKDQAQLPAGYGEGFDRDDLAEHYQALIGDPGTLDRNALLHALHGTEFDEHAYINRPTVEATAKALVNQLLEGSSLCDQHPHLANLMANIFGGYPDHATQEKEEPGECENLLAFGQQEGADLATAEAAAQKYAAKFKEWGGIPFEGDVPEYDQLLASDPGLKAIQTVVAASD